MYPYRHGRVKLPGSSLGFSPCQADGLRGRGAAEPRCSVHRGLQTLTEQPPQRRSGRLAGCGGVQRRTDPWHLWENHGTSADLGEMTRRSCVKCLFFFNMLFWFFYHCQGRSPESVFHPLLGCFIQLMDHKKSTEKHWTFEDCTFEHLGPVSQKQNRLNRLGLESPFPPETAIRLGKSPFLEESMWKQMFGEKTGVVSVAETGWIWLSATQKGYSVSPPYPKSMSTGQ